MEHYTIRNVLIYIKIWAFLPNIQVNALRCFAVVKYRHLFFELLFLDVKATVYRCIIIHLIGIMNESILWIFCKDFIGLNNVLYKRKLVN